MGSIALGVMFFDQRNGLVGLFYYTIPCANIASATFTKPAIFAPLT